MLAHSPSARRFVILISGRGSNMQVIVRAVHRVGAAAEVCAVISNEPDAPGLAWAGAHGLATHAVPHRGHPSRESFDAALAHAIDRYEPHYVLLAGFMRILTPGFVDRYAGRLVNIHPSLLPAFTGLHTHQRALDAGVCWHGCTVHFVTADLDCGPIIAQGAVPVREGDDARGLAERVLVAEHALYGEVAGWLASGRVRLDAQGRVTVSGAARRSFVYVTGAVEALAPEPDSAGAPGAERPR